MQFWRGNRTVALVFPGEDISEMFIVAQRFAIGRLMFFAEMATARFVAGECVSAHEFAKFEKIGDASRSFQRLIKLLAVARVPGDGEEFNQSLERAGRVADFLEFAELMCTDALTRDESCGGHFREEHQTPDGEALRDDEHFADVFAWEYQGNGSVAPPKLHREPLVFETVELTQRSYK